MHVLEDATREHRGAGGPPPLTESVTAFANLNLRLQRLMGGSMPVPAAAGSDTPDRDLVRLHAVNYAAIRCMRVLSIVGATIVPAQPGGPGCTPQELDAFLMEADAGPDPLAAYFCQSAVA